MLHCGINLKALTDEELACGACKKCIARSKLDYPFQRDLDTSDALVKALKHYIQTNTKYECKAPEVDKNPDIRVLDVTNGANLVCRVEAKFLEGFAFMKAQEKLGDHLLPKETLVVDEPKLLSYFECKQRDREQEGRDVPIFVVWKFDRPCAGVGGITVFQEIDKLNAIYNARGSKRAFERETVESDYVGRQKRGITAKYHFSLRECQPIENLAPEIMKI